MSEVILQINNLSKHFKSTKAVDGIDLTIRKGEIFGILGPNGSGKTTTLAMVLGILHPTAGSFSWFENGTAPENRLRIGTLLETPNFYPFLNAYDNLNVICKIKEVADSDARIREVLELVDLTERGKRKFSSYSLGMKQRLAVAAALVSNPDVLVLDEPTNGLDPMGIIDMRNLILKIAQSGKTIIIASHILDEIEKICTHVAIMKLGKLLYNGDLKSIMKQDKKFLVQAQNNDQIIEALNQQTKWKFDRVDQGILLETAHEETGENINRYFVQKGIYLSTIKPEIKSLESIFIETVNA